MRADAGGGLGADPFHDPLNAATPPREAMRLTRLALADFLERAVPPGGGATASAAGCGSGCGSGGKYPRSGKYPERHTERHPLVELELLAPPHRRITAWARARAGAALIARGASLVDPVAWIEWKWHRA